MPSYRQRKVQPESAEREPAQTESPMVELAGAFSPEQAILAQGTLGNAVVAAMIGRQSAPGTETESGGEEPGETQTTGGLSRQAPPPEPTPDAGSQGEPGGAAEPVAMESVATEDVAAELVATELASAEVDTSDPGAVLTSIASSPPSQLGPTLAEAYAQSPLVLGEQRTAAVDALPEIHAPTGLQAGSAPPPAVAPPASAAAADLRAPQDSGSDKQPALAPPPEAPPAPRVPTRLSGGEQDGQGDDEAAASARRALGSIFSPTGIIPTALSDRPQVALSGAADPTSMSDTQHQADVRIAADHQRALTHIGQDYGEGAIAPRPDDTLLTASQELSTAVQLEAPDVGNQGLPQAMRTDVDASAGPLLAGRTGPHVAEFMTGQQEFDAGSITAHNQAKVDISEAEAQTIREQTEARGTAQASVQQARADWQSQIDEVKGAATRKADTARDQQVAAVQHKKLQADGQAKKHLDAAEAKAAAKKRDADKQVESKKRTAERDSDGFWGWVKSKAKALIDGLKSAVNTIYDGLRAAVKALFDAAKALAQGVIELARIAIVGLIWAYGEALKGIVSVALAAFPTLRDAAVKRIDGFVTSATDVVNQGAELLKKAAAAIIDFLASTIDQLLSMVQRLYNGIFTLLGMMVSGEWKEIMEGLDNLLTAAGEAPPQFEAAAYEELLGGNMDEPLSPAELTMAGITTPEGGPVAEESALAGPPWSPDTVGVDPVVSGMELSAELAQTLMRQTGGEGDVTFGESDDAGRSMESILGLGTAQAQGVGPTTAPAPTDGLTVSERAAAKWTIMKRGLSDWWSKNWPLVVGGGVLAVGGFIAANILTGGAVVAALPAIMSVLGPMFAAMTIAMVGGHVRDYLTKGWVGETAPAGKSLAKALAVGAMELVSLLTFKVGGAALKGAKVVARGARAAAKGTARVARAGAVYAVKQGKVLLKGIGNSAFGKTFRRLGDLGQSLLQQTRFRGFRMRLRNRRFILEGKINPWVKIAEGRLVDVEEGTPGAAWVDDLAQAQQDFGRTGRLPGAGDDVAAAGRCFVAGTRVAVPSGWTRIEELSEGAMVRASVVPSGITGGGQFFQANSANVALRTDTAPPLRGNASGSGDVLATITNTFVRTVEAVIAVVIAYPDGTVDTVVGTPNHPLWVPALGEYVALEDLAVGTVLRTLGGGEAVVEAKSWRPGDVDVYDVEVEGLHCFYVAGAGSEGVAGVLVHNSTAPKEGAPKWIEKLPDKVRKQIDKAELPLGGETPFRPKLVTKRGKTQISTAKVQHGPRKGETGRVDTEGRIWLRDKPHAGYDAHWDVQIDGGSSHINVGYDGNPLTKK